MGMSNGNSGAPMRGGIGGIPPWTAGDRNAPQTGGPLPQTGGPAPQTGGPLPLPGAVGQPQLPNENNAYNPAMMQHMQQQMQPQVMPPSQPPMGRQFHGMPPQMPPQMQPQVLPPSQPPSPMVNRMPPTFPMRGGGRPMINRGPVGLLGQRNFR